METENKLLLSGPSTSASTVKDARKRLDERKKRRPSIRTPKETVIDETEIQNKALRLSDIVVDILEMTKTARIKFFFKYTVLFFLSGFLYKLWLWFSSCIAEFYGAPCKEEFTLFTMPFIFISEATDHQFISPHFFSFWDVGHITLSIYASLMILIFIKSTKKMWELTCAGYQKIKNIGNSYAISAKKRAIQRERDIKKNLRKKED
jgi:hypothetical protein